MFIARLSPFCPSACSALPSRNQTLTHSSWLVGLSVTLTGGAMFIGLMIGGVLADRYRRKEADPAGTRHLRGGVCRIVLNAMLPEPSLLAITPSGCGMDFFCFVRRDGAAGPPRPPLVGRENLPSAGGAITMLTVRLGSGDIADGGRPAAGHR